MENYNIKLNLMKLSRAGIMQIQGRGEVLSYPGRGKSPLYRYGRAESA